MKTIDKTVPDILRVTEFVLEKAKQRESFSVVEASHTKELNGISQYRIAEILRATCLEPQGPNSLEKLTTIDSLNNPHAEQGNWSMNAEAYFGYLSYQSNRHAEEANKNAKYALWIAIATLVVTSILPLFTA